jgi:hypothetical protein
MLEKQFPSLGWRCGEHDTGAPALMGTFAPHQLIIGRSDDTVVMIEVMAHLGVCKGAAPRHEWHLEIGRPTTESSTLAERLIVLIASIVMIADSEHARCRLEPGGSWLNSGELVQLLRLMIEGADLSASAGMGVPGELLQPRPARKPRAKKAGAGPAAEEMLSRRLLSTMVLVLNQRIVPDWSTLEAFARRIDPDGDWNYDVRADGGSMLVGRGSFIAVQDLQRPCPVDPAVWLRSHWYHGTRAPVESHQRHIFIQAAIDTANADWLAVRQTAMVKTMLVSVLSQLPGVVAAMNFTVGTVFEPRQMKGHLTVLETGHIPIALWSWASPHSVEDGNFCLSTSGFFPFLGHEIEIWNAPVSRTVAEERVNSIMAYLLTNGPVIGHGDTVGRTEDERPIRCFLGPSRAERPEPVQALFIEFDDAEEVVLPQPDLPVGAGSPKIAEALLADAPDVVKKLLAGYAEAPPPRPVGPPEPQTGATPRRPGSFGRKGL